MDSSRLLITAGLAIALLGLILKYAPWLIAWFGKLPGDINIKNEHSRIFIPITSMIVLSALLTLIANLWLKK
jgi:hypothetical protein